MSDSSVMAPSAANVIAAARAHFESGRHGEAIAALETAARLVPNDPVVLHDLGVAFLFARRLPEAVSSLRRSIELDPTVARVHFELGIALAQSGREDGALAALRTAAALDPSLAQAHGEAGDILRRKNRMEEASSAYDRAFRASPETVHGLLCRGKALVASKRAIEAEACLKQIVEGDAPSEDDRPLHVEAELVLGHLLLDAGRFDEAAAAFERSIGLAPRQATAYLGLVTSKKITERDRAILERILDRLQAREVTDGQRVMLHFAAGKALDDLGDYVRAMEHFDAGNRIRRRSASFDGEEIARGVDRLIARFTRRFFAESAASGADDETPILIVGMPRSGTTLVERIVSSHPRVACGGEQSFWNRNAPSWVFAPAAKLETKAGELRGSYLRLLRGIAPQAPRVTDKMPFNFLWLGLVHALLPRARIIHCRSHPIDTCLSIYSTYFAQPWAFASDRRDLAAYYRQYARLMDHWRAVLPGDRMIDVDYETATANPESAARTIVAFLGLEWDDACLRPERNAAAVQTASRWQARQPIYRTSVARFRHYEPWLGELRDLAALAP